MKKFTTGALALSLISNITMANNFNNIYVGGGIIIQEKIDGFGTGKAVEAYIGTTFDNKIGAEIKVTKTFDKAKTSFPQVFSNGVFSGTAESEVTTVGLYATYTHNLTDEISIVPKLGFAHASGELDLESEFSNKKDTESSLAYGMGVKYQIKNGFNAYLNYIKVTSDIQHISMGVEKKF